MKIEGGGGSSRHESAGELFNRFLRDQNDEIIGNPPEPSDALEGVAQGAALAATLAFATPTASNAQAETARVVRTIEQTALDTLIASFTKVDREKLKEMVETISNSPIDAFDERFFSQDELKCLTDNVYHEARSEPLQGRYAVIFSTLARVLDERYPKTICGVVHQPWQFSWTRDQKILAQKINPREYLKIAVEVHQLMKDKSVHSAAAATRMAAGLPQGAIFYKRAGFTGSPPVQKFFAKLVHVATIGAHEFYVERRDDLMRLIEDTVEPKKARRAARTSPSPADELPPPQHRVQKSRGS